MFVPIHGSGNKPDFAGHTLVIPCVSAGMSALIGLDLYALNEPSIKKVGYYSSEHLAPGLSNDGLSPVENSGVITLPAEIFSDPTAKLTFLTIRSGPVSSQSRIFGIELTEFVKTHNFKDVIILSSTLSPVQRERHSNRLIPEVFAYVSNALYQKDKDFYGKNGIRKFGYWLGADKKKPHQELDELMGAGHAQALIKIFNKTDIEASLYVIFGSGGIDFVGGYSFHQFLKSGAHSGTSDSSLLERKLGTLQLTESSGEAIHQKLFEDKTLVTPAYWKAIVQYF